MSDPQSTPDDRPEIDAIGVDADFVTNDHEPDASSPVDEQAADGDGDEGDVADLP